MNFDKEPTPEPPEYLRAETKEWFSQVVGEFILKPHHLKLLVGACEALDRASEAREAILRDGLFFKNRFGEVRKHPGSSLERDSMIAFSRLLRELCLDLEEPSEAMRPPALGPSIRRAY